MAGEIHLGATSYMSEKFTRELGKRLRELRKKNSLTQMDVSRKSKVWLNIISDVERGKRPRISLNVVRRLIEASGASLKTFFRDFE